MENKIKIEFGKISYTHSKITVEKEKLNDNHCHDKFEILYVIDGKGRFILEGREYPIRPRTLIVIPPLEYHYINLVPGSAYDRCVIHFTEAELVPECREYLLHFEKKELERADFYITEINSEPAVSLFEQLDFLGSMSEKDRSVSLRLLVSQLILLLSVTGGDKVTPSEDELGARVIKYLNEHIERDVSLDKLAKRFFVSKYYLCRAFKKYNGISVHGYINKKRIMLAKQLIESGETASGAAYKVGFGDYSAFYRAYIKIVGKSPMRAADEQ